MARQAEAEREKRAKIIAAEGEELAAGRLANASDVMMAHPLALQLRNLQTRVEISVDKNSTVIFPAPLMPMTHRVVRRPQCFRRHGVLLSQAIQTSAEINPGGSGGALVDLSGRVIGIPNLAGLAPEFADAKAPGIGFAIPSGTVRRVATS